jgi:hypothetical protein
MNKFFEELNQLKNEAPNIGLDYLADHVHTLVNNEKFEEFEMILREFNPYDYHVRLTLALLTYSKNFQSKTNYFEGFIQKVSPYLFTVKSEEKAKQILKRLGEPNK